MSLIYRAYLSRAYLSEKMEGRQRKIKMQLKELFQEDEKVDQGNSPARFHQRVFQEDTNSLLEDQLKYLLRKQ